MQFSDKFESTFFPLVKGVKIEITQWLEVIKFAKRGKWITYIVAAADMT